MTTTSFTTNEQAGHREQELDALRQSRMVMSLLDSIPDLIFYKDIQGVYLGCNRPFAELVGRSREEIIGKTDHQLFAPDVADSFRDHDQRMLQLGEARHNEESIIYPDGRERMLETLKTPYREDDGTLIGILGISRDITEANRPRRNSANTPWHWSRPIRRWRSSIALPNRRPAQERVPRQYEP